MDFKLTSQYQPTGDQPEAIAQLTQGIKDGERSQVLLGVTGSGKTFTIANVIANINRPTLILSHNKTTSVTTITISQRHICRRLMYISKKTWLSMMR